MTIIKTFAKEPLSNKTIYKITHSSKKLKNIRGQVVEVAAAIIYSDVGTDGEERTILSIMTLEGEVYATNSETFVREFREMAEFFATADEELPPIKIDTGTSNNGREFLSCVIA